MRLANRTKVLRSTGLGTILVHQFLKPCLAMMLCCMAKSPSSAELIKMEATGEPGLPESMDLGTTKLPTNPIA